MPLSGTHWRQLLLRTTTNETLGLQNLALQVFDKPKFGRPDEAVYRYRDNNFYVYVDPACTGLIWGKPAPEFKYRILTEFIDVAVGLRNQQFHSTSKIQCRQNPAVFRGRDLFRDFMP
jgi:hypothetical protein